MSTLPAAPESLIRVEDLSVGFQSKVVLKEIELEIPSRGIFLLLGPGGAGKSTLLRTLGRWNEHHPAFWVHGRVWLDGRDLLREPVAVAQRRVALLTQKARLYTATVMENALAEVRDGRQLSHQQKRELARGVLEPVGLWDELARSLECPVTQLSIARQRMLTLARLVSGGAQCLLCDEPLRDAADAEVPELAAFLKRLGERLAVVLITHDQAAARALGDRVCLLSGRRVAELTDAASFFARPATELGVSYLRTGNAWPSTPSVPPSRGHRSTSMPTAEEAGPRPGGFHWIIPRQLGGTQMPGLLNQEADDLAGLRRLRIHTLVSLTEQAFDPAKLAFHGIRALHLPIVDMDVPALDVARALCARLSALIDSDRPVVLHCKAGLGRTGTMLACALVYRGENAVRAVHRVRAVNPLYIQSERQLAFVATFESYLRDRSG